MIDFMFALLGSFFPWFNVTVNRYNFSQFTVEDILKEAVEYYRNGMTLPEALQIATSSEVRKRKRELARSIYLNREDPLEHRGIRLLRPRRNREGKVNLRQLRRDMWWRKFQEHPTQWACYYVTKIGLTSWDSIMVLTKGKPFSVNAIYGEDKFSEVVFEGTLDKLVQWEYYTPSLLSSYLHWRKSYAEFQRNQDSLPFEEDSIPFEAFVKADYLIECMKGESNEDHWDAYTWRLFNIVDDNNSPTFREYINDKLWELLEKKEVSPWRFIRNFYGF